MAYVSGTNSTTSASTSQNSAKGINDVGIDGFLELMIAEMQNQDPLNPMENSEMLQQLSQMRSISATDKLTSTLDAVLLGQNLTTASSLIGKEIDALTDDGKNISGTVERVTVTPGADDEPATVKLHVGSDAVSLSNVREVLPAT